MQEASLNLPDRGDVYLAQIAAEVRSLRDPGRSPQEFVLKFKASTESQVEEQREETEEEAQARAQHQIDTWNAWFGLMAKRKE